MCVSLCHMNRQRDAKVMRDDERIDEITIDDCSVHKIHEQKQLVRTLKEYQE